MFAAIERLRAAHRDASVWKNVSREDKAFALTEPGSLLSGLLSQMHRRDTLVTAGQHPLLNIAVAQFFPISVASLHTVACTANDEETAAIAAGIALKSTDSAREPQAITVALLRSFPALTGAIRLMESQDLPLVLIAQGEAESRAATEKRMQSTTVPILPVDASDAVAVCRVMQESLLRARNGWGGAVVHAIRMPGHADVVAEMRKRMQARDLVPA